jgi:hypothetical protein
VKLLEPVLLLIALGLSPAIAATTRAASWVGEWPTLVLFWHAARTTFSLVDPTFGKPLNFFLFTLPDWQSRAIEQEVEKKPGGAATKDASRERIRFQARTRERPTDGPSVIVLLSRGQIWCTTRTRSATPAQEHGI